MQKAAINAQRPAEAGCLLVLLLFAGTVIAQETTSSQATATVAAANESHIPTAPTPLASQKIPAVSPGISYAGGQLSIHVLDSTLAEVLAKVATLTDVKIDVPAGAAMERMPVVELGPGPARQILASLLSDSDFDYLIQASDSDPGKIHSVLLIPREKKGSGDAGMAASRSSVAGPATLPEGPPQASVAAAQTADAVSEASSFNPQPGLTLPQEPAAAPAAQPEQLGLTRPGALTPPQTLSPQSISQQLQQMYQQRMQMIQQERQTGQADMPTSGNR